MTDPSTKAGRERAVLLGLLTLTVFISPDTSWWLGLSPPWYLPYTLWLALIVLAAWLGRARRNNTTSRPDEH